jgi:hypothetical protein
MNFVALDFETANEARDSFSVGDALKKLDTPQQTKDA